MNQIAEQLAGQVLDEKQVYLDNARLKHGVPRSAIPAAALAQGTQPATGVKQQGSFWKTAAIVGATAAIAGFGIPPIVSALAGKAATQVIESPPKGPSPLDLVNWLRDEGFANE